MNRLFKPDRFPFRKNFSQIYYFFAAMWYDSGVSAYMMYINIIIGG